MGKLDAYHRKRDLARTPEPAGRRRRGAGGEPRFVVHQHDATSLATGKRERWLLVKMADEAADARRNPVSGQPESVRSGRTIDQ